jgi:uncharacterized protein (DUF58 family)
LKPGTSLSQAEALAAGLPKLLLAAEQLAFIAAAGLHGRRRAGAGDSFWQFRDWRNGDDIRRVDWRRSAMGEQLYLREREWEAQTTIALRLHDSPGMSFRAYKNLPSKRDRAMLLLLALASLLLRAGERVALYDVTPPLTGKAALPAIARALLAGGQTPTDAKIRQVAFGDFLTPSPKFAAPPGGAVLQILDPAECDFPFTGRIIFEDFGMEPEIEATRAEDWGNAYRMRIKAQREAVAQAAAQSGQTALFHRTDIPPATALAAIYLALKK